MSKKIKLKGQLRSYMRWPMLLTVFLVAMNICIYLINVQIGLLMSVFIVIYIVVVFILYIYNKPLIMRELISFATQYGQIQKQLLYELGLPYALLDERGRIIWMNQMFSDAVGRERNYRKSIFGLLEGLSKDNLPGKEESSKIFISQGEKDYQVEMKRIALGSIMEENTLVQMPAEVEGCLIAVYLFDVTQLNKYIRDYEEQKLVAGLIYIDNYEEALESIEEVRRSLLIALIDRKINKYFTQMDGLVKKLEKDKYFIVMKNQYLKVLEDNRFDLLDEVKTVNIGNEMAVTLSMGFGAKGNSYNQNYEYARTSIDLALGRGGDQAVVRKGSKISYYGGKSKQVEKSTRVKARVKAHALREIMETKERVFIMGHKIPDVDSLGAAVGIFCAARAIDKKAHIIINETSSSIRAFMELFTNSPDYGEDMFISSKEALEQVEANAVVVVVDVNKPSYTECPELLTLGKSLVVLDHHRQGSEVISNAVLSYVEPYASSACEMAAEILQYFDDGVKIKPLEADALYAGILIDTNNFLTKTGVRTFEAAAYLRRCGADVTRVRKMLRNDMSAYKARAEAVRHAEVFKDSFAIAVCPSENIDSPTVVGAQAANELLNIIGVKASFVLTEYQDRIYVSARSIDEINVQLVMEKFGGGGHMNTAGAQLTDMSIEEAKQRIREQLGEMLEKGDI